MCTCRFLIGSYADMSGFYKIIYDIGEIIPYLIDIENFM
jgi:hypothetical protein